MSGQPLALVGAAGAVKSMAANGTGAPVFPQTPTTGNALFCVTSTVGSSTVTAVSAAGWTQLPATSSTHISLWYKLNCAGASEVAPSFTSTSAFMAFLFEFSGVQVVDKNGDSFGTTAPFTATASLPDANPNNLVIAAAEVQLGTAGTTTTSFSTGFIPLQSNDTASSAQHLTAAYQINTAGGTNGVTVSSSAAASNANVQIASFQAQIVPAPGSGSLTFGGTGSATNRNPLSGSGAVAFNGSGTASWGNHVVGSGSVAFAGSGWVVDAVTKGNLALSDTLKTVVNVQDRQTTTVTLGAL